MENEKLYAVIQEGGSSTELYLVMYDNREDAEAFRIDCGESASYATTEIVEVPRELGNYFSYVEEIVRSLQTLEVKG